MPTGGHADGRALQAWAVTLLSLYVYTSLVFNVHFPYTTTDIAAFNDLPLLACALLTISQAIRGVVLLTVCYP